MHCANLTNDKYYNHSDLGRCRITRLLFPALFQSLLLHVLLFIIFINYIYNTYNFLSLS